MGYAKKAQVLLPPCRVSLCLKGPHTMTCLSCLPPVFENRLVLDVAMPIGLRVICDGFCATAEDLGSCDRDMSPSQPNEFAGPSQKTFADHCSVLFLC